MKNRNLFFFALMWSAILFGQQKKSTDHPNVLFILVDDLKPTLGTYGDTTAISPNIDALASKGLQFNRAYVNQAVCVASRYNLMTGTRSTTSGLYNFGRQMRDVYPAATTLPQYFKQQGYHVESMGKVYHIGHGNTNDTASWSIPHFKEKVIEYIVPESTGRQLTREEAFFENTRMHIPGTPGNKKLPRGAAWEDPDVLDDAYADGRVANHAIDRLRKLKKNPNQPFFMAVGFARPHLPFSVPKKYWNMYDPSQLPMPQFEENPKDAPRFALKHGGEISQFKPVPTENGIQKYDDSLTRKLIHGYYASVSYMDAQLGRVIDELERLGLEENTIVVLWGDHGWHLGDHGFWTKHTNFEQANRIPLLLVAPGVTKAGATTQQFAETVDLYPTLTALAGLPRPQTQQPLDGINLTPVLQNPETQLKDHAYHAFIRAGNVGEAIRTEQYRLVRWTNIKDNSKVVYELYDYENDPLETENIAKQKPKVIKKLEQILDQYPKAKRL